MGSINLCVLCVFVVRSTPSLGEMYLRIHFTHQSWESPPFASCLLPILICYLYSTDLVSVDVLA
ncbi:hypothetical protein [Microcystis aeruginosa]|uniref:hypothetical protein n=1 Tax=Microcystis aeruginosa TaxID=1126 RepID=UPI0008FF90FB